jgi:poly(3-hydroxybutyrate) depolymerase
VIVVLHGAQSSVSAMQRVSALDAEATRAGLAVVDLVALPAATTGWNGGSCCFAASARGVDDVGYVAAAVAWIRSTWRLDASAITIVGYSNGGMLGYRAVCERPGLVGRLVVVAGARLVPCTSASRPTALLHLHGDADTTVPVGGARWQRWLRTVLPSARSSVAGLGVRDRCTSWVTRTSNGTTVTDGVGCRATVRLVVVHGLTHRWTRSAQVDETALAVAFALGSSG